MYLLQHMPRTVSCMVLPCIFIALVCSIGGEEDTMNLWKIKVSPLFLKHRINKVPQGENWISRALSEVRY